MSRFIKAAAALVLVLAAGLYLGSPYITFHQMQAAVENKDAQALSEHIDFPALKENLKASISAKLMSEAENAPEDNPFAGAGAVFAIALVGPLIDALITPESVAMMMQGEKPSMDPSGEAAQIEHNTTPPEISTGYKDLNTFAVHVTDADNPESKMTMNFKRHGFFSWKLTSIDMPM